MDEWKRLTTVLTAMKFIRVESTEFRKSKNTLILVILNVVNYD